MGDQDRISPYIFKYSIKQTSDEIKGKYQLRVIS